MKKNGFTLIELMVVIVIMSILSAIAIPKLFGMIAKSKASEICPAAGTYVKLMDTYASESNAMGGWSLIGYAAPGSSTLSGYASTNFTYSGSIDANSYTTANATNAWKAVANVSLNDCSKNSDWHINTAIATTNGVIEFTPVLSDASNCSVLTPEFTKIGK